MLNQKIKELRKNANYSQSQLAKILNISRQAMGHYEQGYREIPVDIVKKICVVFNISADELLEIETAEERKKVVINNSFNNNTGKQNIRF